MYYTIVYDECVMSDKVLSMWVGGLLFLTPIFMPIQFSLSEIISLILAIAAFFWGNIKYFKGICEKRQKISHSSMSISKVAI